LPPEELTPYEWQPPRRFGRWGVGVVEQSPGTAVPGLSAPATLDWHQLFGDPNPVEVEVGMGKGLFLLTQAPERPRVNFFGIEETKFVRPVRPGDRLVLVGTGLKVHRRLTRFRTVGYVRNEKVFETTVVGVPIGKLEELRGA
jgi:hypothetical protein